MTGLEGAELLGVTDKGFRDILDGWKNQCHLPSYSQCHHHCYFPSTTTYSKGAGGLRDILNSHIQQNVT